MKVVLAPMEGVVDYVMRDLLTQIGGIDWCLTEFIRVTDRRLPEREFYKYWPELHTGARTRAGVPVHIQLLGGQPEPLAENARVAIDLGAPGIDLNFGCPAKTVNRHDGGASLLREPSRIETIVKTVRKAVPHALPVSAKIRLGYDHKNDYLTIARAAQAGGASWLAVHARTKSDGYRPPAYWEYVAEIRQQLQIPVIANGEIWSHQDFLRCQSVTGCNWYMLGRGLIAQPDLAREIQDPLGSTRLSPTQLLSWLVWFFYESNKFAGPHYAACRTKQWSKLLGRNEPLMTDLFERIKRLVHFSEIEKVLHDERNLYGQSSNLHEGKLPLLHFSQKTFEQQECCL